MKVSVLVLATLFLGISQAFSDSVTLNNGEIIRGEIVSETDAQITIDVSNASKTIISHRLILKSDIKTVQRESVQQKQEQQVYEALTPLQLDPDHEFSKTDYERGIDTLNKFLTTYPESKFAEDVRQKIALWKSELSHVEKGEVKFDNQWMAPDEKTPFMERFLKHQQVQETAGALQSMKDKLSSLGNQRQKLTDLIAPIEQSMRRAQEVLANPPKIRVPAAQVPPGQPAVQSPPYYDLHKTYHSGAGEFIISDPVVVSKAQTDMTFSQSQMNQARQQLATIDVSINDTKQKIAQKEWDNRTAVAQLQQMLPPSTPKPAQATQPTVSSQLVASASSQPVSGATEQKPWVVRNWKKLAVAGGILLALLILSYPLSRMSAQARLKKDQQARVAREELKKLFDRIMIEGERPSGMNTPEGETVPIGKGQDASGRGRWFVVGPDYVWAVQNNGRQDDDWAFNNVETGGPGAIGACVAADAELADSIKTLAKTSR